MYIYIYYNYINTYSYHSNPGKSMEISMYPRSQHSHETAPGGEADALRPSLTPSLH